MANADFGRFEFHPEKAVEAILYIARGLEQPTFHSVSKALYFADLWHLEQYGRLITGDNYVAMKHGPVPSGAYDIMKAARNERLESRFSALVQSAFTVNDNCRIYPVREPNTRHLSKSDLDALDFTIKKCKGMSFEQLTEESHDGAWESADENEYISIESMVETLSNKDELKEYLSSPVPD